METSVNQNETTNQNQARILSLQEVTSYSDQGDEYAGGSSISLCSCYSIACCNS